MTKRYIEQLIVAALGFLMGAVFAMIIAPGGYTGVDRDGHRFRLFRPCVVRSELRGRLVLAFWPTGWQEDSGSETKHGPSLTSNWSFQCWTKFTASFKPPRFW